MPLLALGLLLTRPIADVDIFWQLRLGEMMLAGHGLVTAEPFAATHLGEPLVPLSALAQVLLAAMRRLGGLGAVQALDAAAWTGGFVAAGLAAQARGAQPRRLALALVVCLLLAMPFSGLRPQSFAVLGFGLIMLLLSRDRPLRLSLPAGGLVLVVWQNLHPSVSLAAAYLGVRAALGWARWLTGRRAAPPWAETLLLPIAALALVLTPAGLAVFGVSSLNARMSVAMGATEWLPLFDPANRPFLAMLLTLNGVAGLVIWQRRREVDCEHLAGALCFLLLALVAGRFMLFWALALVPVLAGRAAGSRPGGGEWQAGLQFLAGALLAGVAAAAGLPARFASDLPVAAVDRLVRSGAAGTVYASYPFGGAVLDRGYPSLTVAFDGRYYRYGAAEWALCRAAMAGQVPVATLVKRYRPVAWLLSPALDAPLIAALRARPDEWRAVADDPAAVLFLPVVARTVRSRP